MSESANSNSDVINNDDDAVQRDSQLSASSSDQPHGVKRPSSEDLNFQPSKKSNGSEMAGLALGPPVVTGGMMTDVIEVPENVVGLVIGRGGEQISSIQAQSGCRVQMSSESGISSMRQCTLQGSPQSIDHAKKLINDTINRSRANNTAAPNGNPQYVTQQLLIPGPKCGLIIGKNGETIKNMQESIGVKMLLIQDNQQTGSQPKPLRITGYAEKVEQAKRAVELLLANDDANGRAGGGGLGGPNSMMMTQTRSMGEVIVPRSAVGIIIGKQGETIKRLAQESGTKIQFKPDNDTTTPERCAVIQGTPQQIERATNMIWDLVQRSNGNQAQEVCLMHVPANKTGLVIGKGGETIKAICNETAAHVELSRDPPPNAQEKVFVIRGTPYQIHLAQHMIRIKVGDIPQGTPAPAFQNMSISGGFQQPFPGAAAGAQFNTQQQQWPANGYVPNQDPNWAGNNPYFAGQQQGGFVAGAQQPQFAASQGFQQPSAQPMMQAGGGAMSQGQTATANSAPSNQTAQPTINPATGQPDYSAQWIAYYRSVGLHDQANMIEQQMAKPGQPGTV